MNRHASWHRPSDSGLTAINRRRERRAIKRWLNAWIRSVWA